MQAFFPGGDGWLYGFNARTGEQLWKFDLNPKDSVWPKTRNDGIATPVFFEGKVFMSVGQDPESGEGVGHMYCVDPPSAEISRSRAASGSTTKYAAPSPRPQSPTDWFISPISAAFCTVWISRPENHIGPSICSQRYGALRWLWMEKYTLGMRMETFRPAGRQGAQENRGNQHGQLRLQHTCARERRALYHDPLRSLCHN